ncbi:MAG TPA: MFS transporter [Methanomassiliicoccales archaeon]|jgi:MFS family permease
MKVAWIQVLSSAGLSGSALLIPNMLRGDFGANTIEIGLITAVFNAALFSSSWIFGRASDVHGKRRILQAGLLITSIALLLQVFAHDAFMVGLSRVFVGTACGIYPSALLCHVYENDKKVGKFSAYGSLGFGFGTFFAGAIGIYYGIFIASAAMLFVAFVVSLYLPFHKERCHQVPLFPTKIIVRNFPVYLSVMLRHIGANMIWVVYALFLADLGADPLFIGMVYGVNAAAQFVFMNYVDRFGSKKLVLFGFVFSMLTFPSYTIATTYWMIIPSQVMIAASWSCLYVGSVKYVMERNDEKGTSAGLLQSFLSISAIMGALIGGLATYSLGYHGTMYLATVMAALGLVVFFFSNKWMDRHDAKEINAS